MTQPLQLIPEYRDFVWGGSRLRPGLHTAEAWVVYEQDRIASGPYAGQKLLDAASELGEALLGKRVVRRTGLRFPLLIKLLDCAEWLSLQVHPNDEQARRLEGPEQFGKTEAWYILNAAPGAELLFGLKAGVTPEQMKEAVKNGKALEVVQRHPVQTGDSIFIRPGMIHALGPGLLLYEIQQTSTITYRVWDWDRPASAGRKLHIEQSLQVINPSAEARVQPRPELEPGEGACLVKCPFFTLDLIRLNGAACHSATDGESFHILTVAEGQAGVSGEGWQLSLPEFASLVIPADSGEYRIEAEGQAVVLKASVE